jgi:FtsH-binding integral membrane protein
MNERRPNMLGIVAGAVVFFAWGALWFSVLGAQWTAAVGKSKAEFAAAGFWPFIISFVAGLFVSYCFENMLWHYERAGAAKGAQIGFLTGVCIFAAMLANLYSFEVRPLALMLIDGGYGVIGFVITGAVVGALRARAFATARGRG